MGDTRKSSVTFFLNKLAYAAYMRMSPINRTHNFNQLVCHMTFFTFSKILKISDKSNTFHSPTDSWGIWQGIDRCYDFKQLKNCQQSKLKNHLFRG